MLHKKIYKSCSDLLCRVAVESSVKLLDSAQFPESHSSEAEQKAKIACFGQPAMLRAKVVGCMSLEWPLYLAPAAFWLQDPCC